MSCGLLGCDKAGPGADVADCGVAVSAEAGIGCRQLLLARFVCLGPRMRMQLILLQGKSAVVSCRYDFPVKTIVTLVPTQV
jgi:hypothetical protein